ncbi:MAG: hypothetical protein NWE76_07120 [Candidatus Bathyarchaeota archaeon]|jgi:hypothetical protein|nr:hypothetical protein [Candidatus Bathyarchaeota archaeon]
MRLALVLFASAFLIALLIRPQTLSFLAELSYGVGCSVLAAMAGLVVKFTTSRLGIWEPSERAAVLDELIGRLLVRKSTLQTLARTFCWNILLSFAIIASGFISFGILPVVWIFLNLGVFSAGKGMFMRYTHPWLETAALILSASLGIWGGARLGLLLYHPNIVQPSVFILILGLHGIAATLETSETHSPRG